MLPKIKIYNTLKRKKEVFKPRDSIVKMYACGVTVYDDCHIGHARSLYVFDFIRRYLKYRGYNVIFVRNITDIDDKIINRANQLNINYKELTKKYIDSYYKDLEILNIEKADYEPKATENIEDIILYIENLMKKKFAYKTETGIYFSVRKFKKYGRLSLQSLDDMLIGVRKEPDETKEYPLDFALWKFSKPDEPYFESPWGRGRPGWHIECTVMSQKFLKTDTIDIHGGGVDLIFPHHENEIAQAESLKRKTFVRYWIHSGLLTINGQKMAKSLGNFISIKDFADKYDINILKYFFLSAHYSQPLDYSDKKIEEAKKRFESIDIFLNKVKDLEALDLNIKELKDLEDNFFSVLDNDFNTPKALSIIDVLINLANKNINDFSFLKNSKFLLKKFLDILGILYIENKELDEEIKKLIFQRDKARKEGNYQLADEIRNALYLKGIILEDTKEGTKWRRRI